jgi:dephospho-CoA kinase
MPALRAAFGPQALAADGALDREHMRKLAFSDSGAKRRLEAILHPLIGDEARRQAALAGARPVVFDVPLLAESMQWRGRVDRVVVVDCPESTQVARVAQRPGWKEDAARSVVAHQASRAARRAIADAVIYNDGIDLPALHAEVAMLWRAWTGLPTV